MANESSAIRAGRAFVEFFADDTKLKAGLRGIQLHLRSFGASLRMIGLKLVGLGLAMKAPFLLAINTFSEFGSELWIMSRRIGVSVEDLSVLRYQARLTGVDIEYLEVAFRKMALAIYNTLEGSKEQRKLFQELGIDVKTLKDATPMEAFQTIMKAYGGLTSEMEKMQIASRLFGRGGTRIMDMLKMQAEGFDKVKKVMAEYGLIMTTEEAKGAMQFRNTLVTLKMAAETYLFRIGQVFKPILTRISFWLMDVMKNGKAWIRQNAGLLVSALKFAVGLVAVGLALMAIGQVLMYVSNLFLILIVTLTVAKIVVTGLIALFVALASPLVGLAVLIASIGVVWIKWSGTMKGVGKDVKKAFNEMKETAKTAMQGMSDALATGDIMLAANILWATLKLLWTVGTGELRKIWLKLGSGLISGWQTMIGELQTLWIDLNEGYERITTKVWGNIRIIWERSLAFLGNLWADFVAEIVNLFQTVGNSIQNIWADIGKAVETRLHPGAADTIAARYAAEKELRDRRIKIEKQLAEVTQAMTRMGYQLRVAQAKEALAGELRRIKSFYEEERRQVKLTKAEGSQARANALDSLEKEIGFAKARNELLLINLANLAAFQKLSQKPQPEIPPFEDMMGGKNLPDLSEIGKTLGAFDVPTLLGFQAVSMKKDDKLGEIADNTGMTNDKLDKLHTAIQELDVGGEFK